MNNSLYVHFFLRKGKGITCGLPRRSHILVLLYIFTCDNTRPEIPSQKWYDKIDICYLILL